VFTIAAILRLRRACAGAVRRRPAPAAQARGLRHLPGLDCFAGVLEAEAGNGAGEVVGVGDVDADPAVEVRARRVDPEADAGVARVADDVVHREVGDPRVVRDAVVIFVVVGELVGDVVVELRVVGRIGADRRAGRQCAGKRVVAEVDDVAVVVARIFLQEQPVGVRVAGGLPLVADLEVRGAVAVEVDVGRAADGEGDAGGVGDHRGVGGLCAGKTRGRGARAGGIGHQFPIEIHSPTSPASTCGGRDPRSGRFLKNGTLRTTRLQYRPRGAARNNIFKCIHVSAAGSSPVANLGRI